MALSLAKTVLEFLKDRPDEKFTARQITEWILTTFPEECQAKKKNSQFINTDLELTQQIAAEIGSQSSRLQKKHPELKTTEDRPRQYYYSEKSDSAEVDAAEKAIFKTATGTNTPKTGEYALYPLLSAFLWTKFGVYSKRIDEKRSKNQRGKNGNRWLHPDLVGMEDLGTDWCQEVRDCVNHYSEKRTKLWSFEVKVLINASNVRECFFQAVSNSSWANYGYLVAAEIASGIENELRILAGAHGIGVIWLNNRDISESEIRIPAKERPLVEWTSVNRLAEENKDFLAYIKLIKQFYQTGEARLVDWDIPQESD